MDEEHFKIHTELLQRLNEELYCCEHSDFDRPITDTDSVQRYYVEQVLIEMVLESRRGRR